MSERAPLQGSSDLGGPGSKWASLDSENSGRTTSQERPLRDEEILKSGYYSTARRRQSRSKKKLFFASTIFICATSILVTFPSSADAAVTKLLPPSSAEGEPTTCLDGSPAGYFFDPATSEAGRNKWIFLLQGGGECDTPDRCLVRIAHIASLQNRDGETKSLAEDSLHAASSLETTNPYFKDWNRVVVPYCSFDLWSGRGGKMPVSAQLIRDMIERYESGEADLLHPWTVQNNLYWHGDMEIGKTTAVEVVSAASVDEIQEERQRKSNEKTSNAHQKRERSFLSLSPVVGNEKNSAFRIMNIKRQSRSRDSSRLGLKQTSLVAQDDKERLSSSQDSAAEPDQFAINKLRDLLRVAEKQENDDRVVLQFNGHNIFKAIVKDVLGEHKDISMQSAGESGWILSEHVDEVILSGESAGGMGVATNLEYLQILLEEHRRGPQQHVRLTGLPIAGLYFESYPYGGQDRFDPDQVDVTDFEHQGWHRMTHVYNAFLPPSCLNGVDAAGPNLVRVDQDPVVDPETGICSHRAPVKHPEDCLMSNTSLHYLNFNAVDLFLVESQMDTVQFMTHDFVPIHVNVSSGTLLVPDTAQVWDWISAWRANMTEALHAFPPQVGFFSPACFMHDNFSHIKGPFIREKSWMDVFWEWYNLSKKEKRSTRGTQYRVADPMNMPPMAGHCPTKINASDAHFASARDKALTREQH